MRLFVSVRPSPAVLDQLSALVTEARSLTPGARWAGPDAWHMTLRFLGEVDDPAPVIKALDGAALPPARAVLGPTVQMLGERVLMVPVSGLDDLAAAVVEATAAFGDPPEDRAFTGHLTLARLGRGGRPRPACLGEAVAGEWKVDELALVRSHLGNGPARYEDLFLRPLNFSNP